MGGYYWVVNVSQIRQGEDLGCTEDQPSNSSILSSLFLQFSTSGCNMFSPVHGNTLGPTEDGLFRQVGSGDDEG